MEPSQIIPALPRQKVKHKDGTVGDVMYGPWRWDDCFWIHVTVMGDGETDSFQWRVNDCEPVHEEPRPFRVGDKVKVTNTSVFTTVKQVRIAENGWPEQYVVDEFWRTKEYLRHATPSEVAKYFN